MSLVRILNILAALGRSPDPAYRRAQQSLAEQRSVVMLGYVGIAYPAFYALDLCVYPALWRELGWIRALHCVLGLSTLLLGRRLLSAAAFLRMARVSAISATLSVGLMCALSEGFSSLYVVGMILCFMAISTIEIFRPAALLVTLASITASYCFLNSVLPEEVDVGHAIASTSFAAGAVLFCGLASLLSEKHHRDLFHANARLTEKNLALEEARQHQGQFLSMISHELRSPVNSMLGFIELVEGREASLQPKSRANLTRVRESGRRLLGLINDLLDLSKAEAGRLELHPTSFDLMAVVREVAEATRALVLQRGVEVVVRGPAALSVSSDEQRLRQILTNLASNAAKFTEQGQITLSVFEEDGVTLEVSDTGPGIAPEAHALVFEAFRQVGISAGGTGLGLSIVQRFVQLLGGTIELESEPGRGAAFRVRLGHIKTRAAA